MQVGFKTLAERYNTTLAQPFPLPDQCSIQHRTIEKGPNFRLGLFRILERVKGIEPSYAAWEAAVLPLNYTRMVI